MVLARNTSNCFLFSVNVKIAHFVFSLQRVVVKDQKRSPYIVLINVIRDNSKQETQSVCFFHKWFKRTSVSSDQPSAANCFVNQSISRQILSPWICNYSILVLPFFTQIGYCCPIVCRFITEKGTSFKPPRKKRSVLKYWKVDMTWRILK